MRIERERERLVEIDTTQQQQSGKEVAVELHWGSCSDAEDQTQHRVQQWH